MKQFVTREHEIEPSPGLPGTLPRGETVLWQGRPSARLVSRHVLKTRWIAGYFLVLALWGAWAGHADGHGAGGILFSVAVLVALAALAIGLLEAFAWGVEKTTLYTVTNERIVMRFGVALFGGASGVPDDACALCSRQPVLGSTPFSAEKLNTCVEHMKAPRMRSPKPTRRLMVRMKATPILYINSFVVIVIAIRSVYAINFIKMTVLFDS